MKRPIQIRQGDVFVEYVDELPAAVTELPADPKRGVVLAEGEATGHAHRVPKRHAGRIAQLRSETDARFLRVTAPVPLRHEEHKTRCAICPADAPLATSIATAKLESGYGRDAYRCATHAVGAEVIALAEPGATVLPRGEARVTIHAEYQPGELPRQVAD